MNKKQVVFLSRTLVLNLTLFLFLFLAVLENVSAQSISGRTISVDNKTPVAFVTVALEGTNKGTISDIDGNFTLDIPTGFEGGILFQHVSYERVSLSIREIQEQSVVDLKRKVTEMDAFVFESGENPANTIIRSVIKNRKYNDPAKMSKYTYKSYSKEIYRLMGFNNTADSLMNVINEKETSELTKEDSSALNIDERIKASHLFVSESVADVKFIAPGMLNETVLATNISGFKNGIFAATGSQYQPFGFYDEVITLFGKEYISPINPSALHQYDFYIEDTTFYKNDTIYILSFEPQEDKKIEGLKGLISISTDGYAITNVMAESADDLSKMGIRVQQLYKKVSGKWFPAQLNTDIRFMDYEFYGRYMVLENKRYLSDIDFDPAITKSDFSDVELSIQDIAPIDQQQILNKKRIAPFDSLELKTFEELDSSAHLLKMVEDVAMAFFTLRIPLGKVDLRLDEFGYNKHEDVRFGLGVVTNDSFSKKFELGAYGVLKYNIYEYGDDTWKYGGSVKWRIEDRTDTYALLKYKNDIREVGSFDFFGKSRMSYDDLVRSWQSSKFDRQELHQFDIHRRIAPFMYAQFSMSSSKESTTYPYSYLDIDSFGKEYRINETSLSFRYAKNERYLDLYGIKIPYAYGFPIFDVRVAHGNSDWMRGDFSFTRVDVRFEYKKRYRLGKSHLTIRGGYIDGEIPYGRLITGWGNNSSSMGVTNYFQTMGLYEFVSDKAISIFLNHNVGNILFSSKLSKPELVLYQSFGIGDLSSSERHEFVGFNTMEQGYLESGVGVLNLLRIDMKVGYLGFGANCFYRYGAYQFNQTSDNLFYNLNTNFTF